ACTDIPHEEPQIGVIMDINGEMFIRYGLSTSLLVLILVIVRLGIQHSLFRSTELSVEAQRRWAINLRNVLLFLFILGMIFIWAPQLQTFAVSVFAVAVAFVLATKELIDCLSGSGLRMLTKAYTLGDRIE